MYTAIVGASYAFTPDLSVTAGYSYDWGRNAQDGLASTLHAETRRFDRQLVSFGVLVKF